jgi:hypothetical protein
VGPPARAFCGERANHCASIRTPPCDDLVALGMRAFISSFRCHSRHTLSRSICASSQRTAASIGRRRAIAKHGPHYLIQRPLSLLQTHSYHATAFRQDEPTIYALSTASGKAAIAVIRVSGSACRQVANSPILCAPTILICFTDIRTALSCDSLSEAALCNPPQIV